MALGDIRQALGIERVIWIDDVFGEPDVDLAILARGHPDIQEEFPELQDAFALAEFGDADAELTQVIADLEQPRRDELRAALLERDAEAAPAQELATGTIQAACDQLGVAPEDRWTFEQADSNIVVSEASDESVAYIIDLKEGGGSDRRGLDILNQLRSVKSTGVAFILTHEASIQEESSLELTLENDIKKDQQFSAELMQPITVISKGRLTDDGSDIERSLAIALKRAGLRRTLHRVLIAASDCASKAYSSTATSLLTIEPERLEQFVYDRGRVEGVSELSVVERALSAGASKQMRAFFATNGVVRNAMESLRSLQEISLDYKPSGAGPVLSDLRNSEVWDDSSVINGSFTPLANGDVFCYDSNDPSSPRSSKLFILVGQPCDIMLRADGKRISEMAMLVPLTELGEDGKPVPDPNEPDDNDSDKSPELPFRLKEKKFKLDLRKMAYVRLGILDLASLRPDGCVRVEAGHVPSTTLLAGAKAIYANRTAAADTSLAQGVPAAAANGQHLPIDDRLLLTMSEIDTWKNVRIGVRQEAFNPGKGHHLKPLPARVTWRLRREGRIRSPYSAFVLERTLRTLGRRAFDTDYTS